MNWAQILFVDPPKGCYCQDFTDFVVGDACDEED